MANAEPIHIDLRDLNQAALDECRANVGQCYYAAPCVIGTLIPEGRRRALDNADLDGTGVKDLLEAGYIAFPAEQIADAIALQEAFDGDGPGKALPDFDKVEKIAARYIKQVPA